MFCPHENLTFFLLFYMLSSKKSTSRVDYQNYTIISLKGDFSSSKTCPLIIKIIEPLKCLTKKAKFWFMKMMMLSGFSDANYHRNKCHNECGRLINLSLFLLIRRNPANKSKSKKQKNQFKKRNENWIVIKLNIKTKINTNLSKLVL